MAGRGQAQQARCRAECPGSFLFLRDGIGPRFRDQPLCPVGEDQQQLGLPVPAHPPSTASSLPSTG